MPHWEPTAQEVEDKLIAMAYIWGDVLGYLEQEIPPPGHRGPAGDLRHVAGLVRRAFRVEAVSDYNGWGDPCSVYVLLFDVADPQARDAGRELGSNTPARSSLQGLVHELASPWHHDDNLWVRVVPRSTPVEGQVCRDLLEEHQPGREPTLDDLPAEQPPQAKIGFEQRDAYWLTPIEAKFYDAARDTGLTFAIQPWIQGTDRRYRPDFMFFYDGKPHVVELDGHEWHKTREQRSADAERERWFEERGIRVHRFTGSQVHADPQGCVSELLNLLRGAAARP